MDAQLIETLAEAFKACRKVLLALGDENRQHLLLEMMQMNRCSGARVGEITARTHLSRPAVSHHLRSVCHPYEVRGVPYYDGALGDTIPIEKAFQWGCGPERTVTTRGE